MLWRLFRENEGRLNRQASCTAYQIVAMQKMESIVKALLAHVGENLSLWREENANEAMNVLLRKLDACVCDVKLLVKRGQVNLKTFRGRNIRLRETFERCHRVGRCRILHKTGSPWPCFHRAWADYQRKLRPCIERHGTWGERFPRSRGWNMHTSKRPWDHLGCWIVKQSRSFHRKRVSMRCEACR